MTSQTFYENGRLMGCQVPSVRVSPEYNHTDGVDAVQILRIGGTKLDPWQTNAMHDWMAIGPGGQWLSKTCGLSVGRQNGKSGLVEGRAEAGMIMYNEQVLYTAHLQKTSTETFEEMADFFDSPKMREHVKDIKTALGREQIILKSGARIKFLARTRNGGRGQHGDLLIFDEAQELDENQQASFLPAISASINPQTIYVGTPPTPEAIGTVFRNIRDKAISGETKTTAWSEFSVDKIGDVHDRTRWAQTNPALGLRILESTIEGECEQMEPDMFARERLGWWSPMVTREVEYVIPVDVWDACKSTEQKPEGRTAYGIKFAADGSVVSLCGAVIPKEGPARVSLIEQNTTGQGLSWLADWLNARYDKACCVVIDGRNGVDVLVEKITPTWKMKGSIIRPNVNDMIAAVGTLTDAINEKQITWYEGQEALRNSAVTSIKRKLGGGFAFGGENSTPIEAAALALWGAKNSKRDPKKVMRIG